MKYWQFIRRSLISKVYERHDFGKELNLKHYGQEDPPILDVSNSIKAKVPIELVTARHDILTNFKR